MAKKNKSLEEWIESGYPKAPEVALVVDGIVRLLNPRQIYLYNQRFSVAGATTAFKLCVVADMADKASAERDIYLDIDSEVPFDVILYTPAEWKRLCDSPDSFARKIFLTGTTVYG